MLACESSRQTHRMASWRDQDSFSKEARIEAGLLLRRLQMGEILSMPHSRPMPSIGKSCHELRIKDKDKTWRIIYHIADDVIPQNM